MRRDHLAQWKPGDFFVFRSTGNLPNPCFYREIPHIGGQERAIIMPNVNMNYIYTVTAVYEESTWTAIKFQNRDARVNTRNPEMHQHGMGPAESIWTIARHLDQLLCRHVRIVTTRQSDYDHLLNGTRPRSRNRS